MCGSGLPTGTRPDGAQVAGSRGTGNRVDVIATSVSPYAFSRIAPGAASIAAVQSAGTAISPPVIMSRMLRSRSSPGWVIASSWCQYTGARSATVTCSSSR